jgi:hypothetical protein
VFKLLDPAHNLLGEWLLDADGSEPTQVMTPAYWT